VWNWDEDAVFRAWVRFIRRLGDDWEGWELICTLTFWHIVSPGLAESRLRDWRHRLNRRVLGSRYHRRTHGLLAAVALEHQRRGIPHYHVLLASGCGLLRALPEEELQGVAVDWETAGERRSQGAVARHLRHNGLARIEVIHGGAANLARTSAPRRRGSP